MIVVITVMIDLLASFAMENADDFSKPVVEMLFKELTVLGCIALLVFMSVKTGIPEQISTSVSPCIHAYHIIHPTHAFHFASHLDNTLSTAATTTSTCPGDRLKPTA